MGVGAAIGAGIQGLQAITSGVQGKNAQRMANQQMQQAQQMYQGLMDRTDQVMGGIQSQLELFGSPGMREQVMNQAMGLPQQLMGYAQDAASQIGGGGGADLARAALDNRFDFDPVRQNLELATQTAQESAARARGLAADQAALAQQNSMQALDAAMAARGFSRNSGAAAAALAQLQGQNAMTMAQLESQLADQAGQMALGAAQLDAQNLLQHQGMASQYNLGMNQLGAQTGLGLQQLHDQQAIQRAGLMSDAALGGFNALQGAYQQNVLAPQMQLQGLLASLAGQGMASGVQGIMNLTDAMRQDAYNANAGAGEALGGFLGALGQHWTTPVSNIFGKRQQGPQMAVMRGGFGAQPGYYDWLNQGINRGR